MFSPEEKAKIQDHVLREISLGRALSKILIEDEGMCSSPTWYAWEQNDEELLSKVVRAREVGAQHLLEETLEIADTHEKGIVRTIKPDGTIEEREEDMLGHRKLRIETRHKYAQMIAPRRFGTKVDLTTNGKELPAPVNTTINMVDARIQSILMMAMQAKERDEEMKRLME